MTQSNRKLAGVFLILALIAVWCVLGTMIYENLLLGQPGWLLILYFLVAGMAWMFPAMALIRWMARPDA